MNSEFNSEMLILARELRMKTQAEVASETGIDQGRLSRYEGGLQDVSEDELVLIADVLDFPVDFFFQEGKRLAPEVGEIFHRKRRTSPVKLLKKLDGLMTHYRQGTNRLLEPLEEVASFSIPTFKLYENNRDVSTIASLVRATWKMPSGPVANVVRQLEAASCLIFSCDFGTDKIDEVVQWSPPAPPIIIINTVAPGDRLRFSLAHALGHLVMHHGEIPYEDMEDEADEFAASFLMPIDDIMMELHPVTVNHLAQLKPYWKVSIQALIRRAKDIKLITERQYTSQFQTLSRMGYRKEEPFPIPKEKPELVHDILDMYKDELGYTDRDLSNLVRLNVSDFRRWWYYPHLPKNITVLPPSLKTG